MPPFLAWKDTVTPVTVPDTAGMLSDFQACAWLLVDEVVKDVDDHALFGLDQLPLGGLERKGEPMSGADLLY